MIGLLVDANVIIDHLKDRARPGFALEDLVKQAPLFISTLTITELWAGITPSEEGSIQRLLSQMEVIPVSEKIGISAGALTQKYRIRNIALPTIDGVLAATAMASKLTLVSHDKLFQKIEEVTLYTPNLHATP